MRFKQTKSRDNLLAQFDLTHKTLSCLYCLGPVLPSHSSFWIVIFITEEATGDGNSSQQRVVEVSPLHLTGAHLTSLCDSHHPPTSQQICQRLRRIIEIAGTLILRHDSGPYSDILSSFFPVPFLTSGIPWYFYDRCTATVCTTLKFSATLLNAQGLSHVHLLRRPGSPHVRSACPTTSPHIPRHCCRRQMRPSPGICTGHSFQHTVRTLFHVLYHQSWAGMFSQIQRHIK